jgi:hypothetical protein
MMWRRIAGRRGESPERAEFPGGKDVTTEPRDQQEPSMEEISPRSAGSSPTRRPTTTAPATTIIPVTTNSAPPRPDPRSWTTMPRRSPEVARTKTLRMTSSS